MSKYIITGTAGFIGFHLANTMLAKGEVVIFLPKQMLPNEHGNNSTFKFPSNPL